MTYVEFFDKPAAENVCACLSYSPDRVIYIGDDSKLMMSHIENYKKVFSQRGQQIEFLFKTVSKSNLTKSVELLSEIVETYDDCVFDITGGEEILTVALGIVYSKHPDKNIQIHKFNLRNGAIYDCDKDGTTIFKETPVLSIDEHIRINGGQVAYGAINEDKTYKWDLNEEFLNDVDLIWEICRGNVRFWNVQIGILEAADALGTVSEDGLTTVVHRTALEDYLQRHRYKYKISKGIIKYLLKNGLITYFDEQEDTLSVSYKNHQVKKCLTKAGQALEMKVYVTARALLDKNGALIYNDALNGVVIDWDGEFHDEKLEGEYDTENEIDIMLMHGLVPIFISCKNGIVTSDELYKLNTVAQRFGGVYSKKVLVATSISDLKQSEYLRQRAEDMNIKLIEKIQDFDHAKLQKELKNLWN